MEMDSELQRYVIKNYIHFFTKEECEISNSISKEEKINHFPIDIQKRFRDDLSYTPNEYSLMTKEEKEDFYNKTVVRIISEENIFFNRCPYCGQLAVTIKARQAKCGHSWRDFDLVEEDGKFRWEKPGSKA